MSTFVPSVYYAQGLAGSRWQLYRPWGRLLPSAFMDKFAAHWPARCLWQGEIACGHNSVPCAVYGGPMGALGWLEKLGVGKDIRVVRSNNLPAMAGDLSLPAGRLLLACCLRQVLIELSHQLLLAEDRLTIGLVARGNEMACWWANVEGLARQVTIWTDRRSRLLPLTESGLAPRQLDLSVENIGVDILIVAPEFLPWLGEKNLVPGTVVIRTDGVLAPIAPGTASVRLDFGGSPFPTEFLGEDSDIAPLREAIILAAYHSGRKAIWPRGWSRRLALMEQAVKGSEWTSTWQLVNASAISAG